MNENAVRIATWNILGRRRAGTKRTAPDGAVTEILKRHGIDIVCLQEVHFYNGLPEEGLVRELRAAGFENFAWMRLSESHLDRDASLGIGIASRAPLSDIDRSRLTNPGLRAVVRGDEWVLHDKGMIGCLARAAGQRPFWIYSFHLFPFHEFGVSDDDDRVDKMWAEFWAHFDFLGGADVILAGDFNQTRREVAAKRWSQRPWRFCLGEAVTTSFGLALDEVAVSGRPLASRSWTSPTFSDHSLVVAEIGLGRRGRGGEPARVASAFR